MLTPLYSTYNGTYSIYPPQGFNSELSTFYAIVRTIMLKNVTKHAHLSIPILCFSLTLLILAVWYTPAPAKTEAETTIAVAEKIEEPLLPTKTEPYGDSYVVIHLDSNTIDLHSGTGTETFKIVSQGKPGSYYETIGGVYKSDYKELIHFSSIGHVYMPYSIHIFGNYFIHGIPYYPDDTKVSSAYSGGCVRVADEDIERIYNFITKSTPIIITRGSKDDFLPTATTTATIKSGEMTRLMVASISLELLKQDNEILDTDGLSTTTRKTLLHSFLTGESEEIASLYAKSIGEKRFIEAMNDKAEALGMTNTIFTGVTEPVATTEEDYTRFMGYIATYKSFLLK